MLVPVFFQILNTLRLYHWQTRSYARHKAADELHSNLEGLMDKFMESFMGKYGRPSFPNDNSFKLEIDEHTDESIVVFLEKIIMYVSTEIPEITVDTDLLNIRDEMLTELHKAMYLFTLQ
jgi:Family of unknown function (DUF5856)